MSQIVIIILSGLMEYEGHTEVKTWGIGYGDTLLEVCRDTIRKNPEKGTYFTTEDGHCFDWGMELKLL